jgi:hypothetical protein
VSEQDLSTAPASASPAAPGGDVHRLLDMVVEEVSLVDRPANKRRFLVVKRESEMATKDDADVEKKKKGPSKDADAEGDGAESRPPTKKPGAKRPPFPPKGKKKPPFGDGKTAKAFPSKKKEPEEDDDETSEDEDDGKKKPAKKDEEGAGPPEDEAEDDETPLDVAMAALDSLTQAVEILSETPSGGPELAAVAQDIRQAADAIAAAAGVEAEEEAAEGEGDVTTMATLLSSIQEMLTRLEGLTQAIVATKSPAPSPPTTSAPGTSPELAGTLSEVSQSLKSMDALLKAQAARLETLEKRAGVPNSQPAGESITKAAPPPEPSWPLDMNRPRDRASVDKSVSFYSGESE